MTTTWTNRVQCKGLLWDVYELNYGWKFTPQHPCELFTVWGLKRNVKAMNVDTHKKRDDCANHAAESKELLGAYSRI